MHWLEFWTEGKACCTVPRIYIQERGEVYNTQRPEVHINRGEETGRNLQGRKKWTIWTLCSCFEEGTLQEKDIPALGCGFTPKLGMLPLHWWAALRNDRAARGPSLTTKQECKKGSPVEDTRLAACWGQQLLLMIATHVNVVWRPSPSNWTSPASKTKGENYNLQVMPLSGPAGSERTHIWNQQPGYAFTTKTIILIEQSINQYTAFFIKLMPAQLSLLGNGSSKFRLHLAFIS